MCQCPHGLVPHCYGIHHIDQRRKCPGCQCPHGLVPHCYSIGDGGRLTSSAFVSMPSRASTSLLHQYVDTSVMVRALVSMPSRASTSLLLVNYWYLGVVASVCQCPHGLVPHCYPTEMSLEVEVLRGVSMPSRASTSLLRYTRGYNNGCSNTMCQCPHGLVPHCYNIVTRSILHI